MIVQGLPLYYKSFVRRRSAPFCAAILSIKTLQDKPETEPIIKQGVKTAQDKIGVIHGTCNIIRNTLQTVPLMKYYRENEHDR